MSDQAINIKVISLVGVKAEINGIRVHDNIADKWYNVYPEGEQAYCTVGSGAIHVVFGAANVGDADGNLWGRMTDTKTGNEIIHKQVQWCRVGNFVWWELTFNMPADGLSLKIEVGH